MKRIHSITTNNQALIKLILFLTILFFLSLIISYYWDFDYLIYTIILLVAFINLTMIHFVYKTIYKMKDDYNQLTEFIQLKEKINTGITLPLTRGYAGSPDFLNIILKQIDDLKPKVIVEASCGVSSMIISEYLLDNNLSKTQHFALEHDNKYRLKCISQIRNTNSIILEAKLKKYQIKSSSWLWYDLEGLEDVDNIDLIIVDGPPSYLQKNSRYPTLPLLKNKLAKRCIVIMDDFDRAQEKNIISLWSKEFNIEIEYLKTEKGTGIITIKK